MNVFITDGTPEGFYTAVFNAYREKDAVITSRRDMQLTFDTTAQNVETETEKAMRVRAKLDKIDRFAAGDVDLALRSND